VLPGSRGGGDVKSHATGNFPFFNSRQATVRTRGARYYANDIVALNSQAWLGTGYQIASQLNVVNPGGEAQTAHRDYHMGFQTPEEIAHFPAHAHRLSPLLTLQGAVAHCAMPVESGPTLYLPFSQTYLPGYFAYSMPAFKAHYDRHHVQLALAKGDAAFFNPAVFHAAGHNRTSDVKRMANLLQVSSAYGRATESMDRVAMSKALYPVLRGAGQAGLGEDGVSERDAMRPARRAPSLRAAHTPSPRAARAVFASRARAVIASRAYAVIASRAYAVIASRAYAVIASKAKQSRRGDCGGGLVWIASLCSQ